MEWLYVESLSPIIGIPRGVVRETLADPDQRSREFCVKTGARFHLRLQAARELAVHNCVPPFAIIQNGIAYRFKTKQALVDAVTTL